MEIREMTLEDVPEAAAVGSESSQSPWDEHSMLTYFLRQDTLFVVAEENLAAEKHGADEKKAVTEKHEADVKNAAAEKSGSAEACMTARESGGRRICGFAALLLTPPESDVLDIVVTKERRNRGIGTKLLDALCDQALLRGVDTVFLEVRPSNLPARKIYEKLGFTETGIRKNYYTEPVEDAITMVRRRNICFVRQTI